MSDDGGGGDKARAKCGTRPVRAGPSLSSEWQAPSFAKLPIRIIALYDLATAKTFRRLGRANTAQDSEGDRAATAPEAAGSKTTVSDGRVDRCLAFQPHVGACMCDVDVCWLPLSR